MSEQVTQLWEKYRAGLGYQRAMGFTDLFPECIRMKEDDQWPAATKATRHLPRPVFNLIEMFIRTKRAGILNQQIKMIYSPSESTGDEQAEAGAKAYTDYAAHLWKELRQEELNEDFIDDAATLGTGILHYYWDDTVDGGRQMPYTGALRGEVLDPLSICFGNPQERDVQKQPYILLVQRTTVKQVRELAEQEGCSAEQILLIQPDDERTVDYDSDRHEMRGEEKCTLLTMYYRKNGAVYFDKGTRDVVIVQGRSLTPDWGGIGNHFDRPKDADRGALIAGLGPEEPEPEGQGIALFKLLRRRTAHCASRKDCELNRVELDPLDATASMWHAEAIPLEGPSGECGPDGKRVPHWLRQVGEGNQLSKTNEVSRSDYWCPPSAVTRYPIVVMSWKKRKHSIYGIGEAAGLIPTQKAVNWLMGMNILSAQDTAWPKLLVKEGALRQEVTNQPGEILRDYSMGGDGIKYLQPPNFSAFAVDLVSRIKEMIRETSGVSEVSTGEPFTATMAASAIIALQNQAKAPIENIQRRFYRAIEEVGLIWEQFFKCYYNLPRSMTVEDPLGQETRGQFLGSDFADVEFRLEVDVGAGSEYSEALAQSTLDKLYDKGDIDLATYIELAPKAVMPFKEQLKRILEQRETEQAMTDEGPAQDGLEMASMPEMGQRGMLGDAEQRSPIAPDVQIPRAPMAPLPGAVQL